MFWVVIFSSILGTVPMGTQEKVRMGPFSEIRQCYSMAALSIDHLNAKNPNSEFRAACLPTGAFVEGSELLDLRQLADRALAK